MDNLNDLFWTCHTSTYETCGHDVNYLFVEENTTLYIYFQGSNSKIDWIRNFLFPKKPYKHMETSYRVHRGFLAAWKEVEDIIIEKITEKDDKGNYKFNKIYSIGYSHGGPLSGLCHECVWFNRPDIRNNIIGYGFESPRFYSGFWVRKKLKERWANYTVVRNHTDLVTHVPPVIFAFRHVGNMIKVGKGAKYGPIKSHYPNNVRDSLIKYDEQCINELLIDTYINANN